MTLTCPDPPPGLDLTPRRNVTPSQPAPIVRPTAEDPAARLPVMASWGFVPAWSKSPSEGRRPINARSETVAESRLFGPAFRSRRCIVPASGFYEWETVGTRKVPRYFAATGEGGLPPILLMAGLFEHWGSGADRLETFTILTTEPNEIIRPFHDRMPVIIEAAELGAWLDPRTPAERVVAMLRPAPSSVLTEESIPPDVFPRAGGKRAGPGRPGNGDAGGQPTLWDLGR